MLPVSVTHPYITGTTLSQAYHRTSFVKARKGSIYNVTRIERSAEANKLFIHTIFRPHWWVKGEASYYLSGTDYNYLRELFQFNGIPHYVFMNADGSILLEELSPYDIEAYLKEHFKLP